MAAQVDYSGPFVSLLLWYWWEIALSDAVIFGIGGDTPEIMRNMVGPDHVERGGLQAQGKQSVYEARKKKMHQVCTARNMCIPKKMDTGGGITREISPWPMQAVPSTHSTIITITVTK